MKEMERKQAVTATSDWFNPYRRWDLKHEMDCLIDDPRGISGLDTNAVGKTIGPDRYCALRT
jgi:hypothetical protein